MLPKHCILRPLILPESTLDAALKVNGTSPVAFDLHGRHGDYRTGFCCRSNGCRYVFDKDVWPDNWLFSGMHRSPNPQRGSTRKICRPRAAKGGIAFYERDAVQLRIRRADGIDIRRHDFEI